MATDQTAFISNLMSRGGTPYLAPGNYTCNGMIDPQWQYGTIIDWPGVSILRTDRPEGRRAVLLIHCKLTSNLTLRRLHLLGPCAPHPAYIPKYEGQHAIGLYAADGTIIEDCYIEGFPGDGIYCASIGGAVSSQPTTHTVIRNNSISAVGRHGISLTGVDGVQIYGNTVADFGREWLDNTDKRVASDVHLNITAKRTANTIIPYRKAKI